jgi:poly-gamma-glutamate capsule biosynthesis protein CapA/YwtB (metallophosphatase superfamily)
MSTQTTRVWPVALGIAGLCFSLFTMVGHGQITASGQRFAEPPVAAPRDAATNLATKVMAPFTVTSVGDVMVKRTGASLEAPEFQSVFKLLRDADVTFGNMEGNLANLDEFDGPLRGMMGDRDVAPSLKTMGFDLMNRANNHIFDSDKEGMFSTMAQLDAAGIVHAGTGKNLEDARAPAYFDSPKGRVALVAMHAPHSAGGTASGATYQSGNVGGKPGLNALDLTISYNVTAEQLAAIKAVRRATYTPPSGTTNVSVLPDAASEPADRVQFLGVWYKVGTPGTRSFEMNKDDLQQNLRSMRNGKYLSEFLISTCHCHQGPITSQQWLFEDQTPDFLMELARRSIDNGADMFVGHGPHVLRGIEIYKGKPIFYGMGEFYYQWQHMDADLMTGSWQEREMRGDSDVASKLSATWRPVNFESLVAQSYFDKGKLVEVRLYPTSGAWDGPVSQLGLPRQASPAQAQKILARVQALSKAFGTVMTIENNVGIIRVDAGRSTASLR